MHDLSVISNILVARYERYMIILYMIKINIIGGGLSGLAASCYLAKHGFDVTLIDKNKNLGGRLTSFNKNGFKFDMGPTWYWMPDVFDSFFSDFNKKVSDYYTLKRLDPSYKFFINSNEYDIPVNEKKLYSVFESIENGSSYNLKQFLSQAKKKYEISMKKFIYLPNKSIFEYLSFSLLKNIFILDIFKSLRNHISSFFKSKSIKNMLEFPSMFLGGTPINTPALYSLMNFADIVGGTWYPMGGMQEVSNGFEKLSKELGVKHIYNEEIENFKVDNRTIVEALSKSGEIYKADVFICCAEYPFVQSKLLKKKYRTYNSKYWSSKNIAPSALIFYLGFSEKLIKLDHHNLFFDKDFDRHLDDIFNKNILPGEPLFYACCPSKTDVSVIPDESMENLYVLIPIAANSDDNDNIREKYFNDVIDRIEKVTGQSIKDKIIFKESFCVKDFKKKYNAYKGNAYGLANTLFQTAFLKPKIKDKKVQNLYYSGHFTVPGPGLPPAIISGKIVSNEIIKEYSQ